ncbi:dTDP-4-amino-4,6-dideoxygalactose transaminase [Pseudoalteromonas piscicida]|uniref:dTDP-4-amino-4,6-dideoxygalactose transaminase n=1 Tax=Pseudoalteromonas piscicida TaxID=43662 RepID=UPI0030A9B527
MIPFNIPPSTGSEIGFISEAIKSEKLCGDGKFSKACEKWFEDSFKSSKALLTPSCTAALELAAILIGIEPGDEIIMPSYTFVSTANAFVLRGAKVVFVDIRKDTMNLDEALIEEAITERTKAIIPVHYAGVSCDMDTILSVAKKYNLWVIEDAAQGVMSTYKGKALGAIGHIGCFSFHETKNYTSGGEGGAILIQDKELVERAEIIREKGTDRSRFLKGAVDKYTWVDIGSSFLPSELQSAYLWGQLTSAEEINSKRLKVWDKYYNSLKCLESKGVELPAIPVDCKHNAHMFYIKVENIKVREELIAYLKQNDISSAFHYVPLHSSKAGRKFGRFHGEEIHTTSESERLLRLPMFYSITEEQVNAVVSNITCFFEQKCD